MTQIVSLDGDWLLLTDPENVGRERRWWQAPMPGAAPAPVPGIIQEVFPGYHGVAWYWREFAVPASKGYAGRRLLRFWAVDYKADVWLNGTHLGEHEDGEECFVLDATEALRPEVSNLLAVRVLNPTHEPIDGIVLAETAHGCKSLPFAPGQEWNYGGIVDSVELVLAPPVRIADLSVRPDAAAAGTRVQAEVTSYLAEQAPADFEFTVAPASGGEPVAMARFEESLPSGDATVTAWVEVAAPRLWELNDPFLYRVTARLQVRTPSTTISDEHSVRCGFRDFRFQEGYFRLNRRRVFLRSAHTCNSVPTGQRFSRDPDLHRRDMIYMKAMGFNMVRFHPAMATRRQLDLCDELGLLVYEQPMASWLLQDSPHMAQRFDRSLRAMVRRDRNHPSVAIWGLLNETPDGPVFRHAVAALPFLRTLDDSRMVILNSGRFDGQLSIGSLSNPGSTVWEHRLGAEGDSATSAPAEDPGSFHGQGDFHTYPYVPHSARTITFLRTLGEGTRGVFFSEYGVGSAVDLLRTVRHFERLGAGHLEDAAYYRQQLERFTADWRRWRLAEVFGRPEDYFAQCLSKNAGQRLLGLNAIRANPHLVGYSMTSAIDHLCAGEGPTTTFRELKPGAVDALADGLAPLRWCLFVEPWSTYRGGEVRLEAVLANEDALGPGVYEVELRVFGPHNRPALERRACVEIAERKPGKEPPLALPVFAEEVAIEGPPGQYRFVANFVSGAAAAGGEAGFHIADADDMPPVSAEVMLWGDDAGLEEWLTGHGIRAGRFGGPAVRAGRGGGDLGQVILISGTPPSGNRAQAFDALVERVEQGSVAVVLTPEALREGDNPTHWLPLSCKGNLESIDVIGGIYCRDDWARRHPMFEGLPCGGLMDWAFYRNVVPEEARVFTGLDTPAEAVAGAINTSWGYASGLYLAVFELGSGRLILNALRIRENLGCDPAADRLFRNILNYATSSR